MIRTFLLWSGFGVLVALVDLFLFTGPVCLAMSIIVTLGVLFYSVMKRSARALYIWGLYLAVASIGVFAGAIPVNKAVAQKGQTLLATVNAGCMKERCPDSKIKLRKFGYLVQYFPESKNYPAFIECQQFSYRKLVIAMDGSYRSMSAD